MYWRERDGVCSVSYPEPFRRRNAEPLFLSDVEDYLLVDLAHRDLVRITLQLLHSVASPNRWGVSPYFPALALE